MKRHQQTTRWRNARARWRVRRRAELLEAHRGRVWNLIWYGHPEGPQGRARELQGIRQHMPMRTCYGCGVPVACDAFGNTDHVCFRLNAGQRALMDGIERAIAAGQPVRVLDLKARRSPSVIIESTAAGISNHFHRAFERAQHGEGGTWRPVFLPWYLDETKDENDDD